MTKCKAFLKKYGFYALVAVCVAGVAALSYLAVISLIGAPAPETPHTQTEEYVWDIAKRETGKDGPPELPKLPQEPPSELPSDLPPTDTTVPSEPVSAVIEPQTPQYAWPTLSRSAAAVFSGSVPVKNETLGEWRTHNGADYDARKGEDIFAVYGGKVTSVSSDGLWGGIIEIYLDTGITARYCGVVPAEGMSVNYRVEKGDVIGTLEGSPLIESASGEHLHLELIGNSGYLDPAKIIG